MAKAGGVLSFSWRGSLSASKSILNRALIIQSYNSDIRIVGESRSDDVLKMQAALADLARGQQEFDCGEAGTTFRFLAFRASRNLGSYFLRGAAGLLARPHQDLLFTLEQLGVNAQLKKEGLQIESQGWAGRNKIITVPRGVSSQFASGLLLNCWLLDDDINIMMDTAVTSESYLQMTFDLLKKFSMKIDKSEIYKIAPHQRPQSQAFTAELDMSSAFTVAAAAALCGEAQIDNFAASTQPDALFVTLLESMGVHIDRLGPRLSIKRKNLCAIDASLAQAPDLFPVLAVLCAFAEGTSQLWGAPHLAYKESNRLESVSLLLRQMGIVHELKPDGMIIYGRGLGYRPGTFEFNPQDDHRLAMAAGIVRQMGIDIKIENKNCVNKSFPEFWDIIGDPT